ncbi:MAG: AbrB/MazE/SpoVT family DNA-binding domain-containing protein [Terracidiphilus sp.]|jgi:AbrB family looped-hinge helix DNA binding protein
MPSATLTSKGQITIPIQVRTALGLDAGDKIDFVEIEKGQFAIKPRTGSIMDMKGCFPKLGYVPTIEEMDQAVRDAVAENYLAGLREPAPE